MGDTGSKAKLVRVLTVNQSPVPDSGHGEGFMTLEQWRRRDRALKLVRLDDDTGAPLPEEPDEVAPTEPPPEPPPPETK